MGSIVIPKEEMQDATEDSNKMLSTILPITVLWEMLDTDMKDTKDTVPTKRPKLKLQLKTSNVTKTPPLLILNNTLTKPDPWPLPLISNTMIQESLNVITLT